MVLIDGPLFFLEVLISISHSRVVSFIMNKILFDNF